MALIDRSDLQYDYSWSSAPGNRPHGVSDSMFDRNEGNDILSIINDYAEEKNIQDKTEGLRIETLIRDELSEDAKRRQDVTDWLDTMREEEQRTSD